MRPIPVSVLAVLPLLLSACATTGSAPYTGFDSCARLDCKKMAEVDREARLNGLTVVWVHPPEKVRTQTP